VHVQTNQETLKSDAKPAASAITTLKQRLLLLIALGAMALRLLVAVPAGLDGRSWSLLVLFFASLAGLALQPAPMGVIFIGALAIAAATGTITATQTLAGYSNSVLWLIIIAFMFARAFVKTGLGRRIALLMIERIGTNSLRLGYCLSLTDLILALITPSNTARTGAIVFPIAIGLAQESGSYPGATASRLGAFLLFTAQQVNLVTSALFLTAMASNPLAVEFARQIAGVQISWGSWLAASCIPGLASMAVIPWFIYKRYPPEIRDTPRARKYAREELGKLGPASRQEKILVGVFVLLAAVWATSLLHNIDAMVAGLGGLFVLLLTQVLSANDLAEESRAWETFIWWGGMLSIVTALNQSLVPKWFTAHMSSALADASPSAALLLVVIVYTYIHYAFAGQTAHVVALYIPFLTIAVGAGAPAMLAALLLCFFSNLNSSLTQYSNGAAPIYYGAGYIDRRDWWRLGFEISLVHLFVWLGIGLPWWKFLRIW
jgi:divalent anion:Na+ symporter, DASS family